MGAGALPCRGEGGARKGKGKDGQGVLGQCVLGYQSSVVGRASVLLCVQVRRPYYFVTNIVLAIFMIVSCTNGMEWASLVSSPPPLDRPSARSGWYVQRRRWRKCSSIGVRLL